MSIDIFRAKKNQTISKLFNGHLMYGILYRDNKIPISTLKKHCGVRKTENYKIKAQRVLIFLNYERM